MIIARDIWGKQLARFATVQECMDRTDFTLDEIESAIEGEVVLGLMLEPTLDLVAWLDGVERSALPHVGGEFGLSAAEIGAIVGRSRRWVQSVLRKFRASLVERLAA